MYNLIIRSKLFIFCFLLHFLNVHANVCILYRGFRCTTPKVKMLKLIYSSIEISKKNTIIFPRLQLDIIAFGIWFSTFLISIKLKFIILRQFQKRKVRKRFLSTPVKKFKGAAPPKSRRSTRIEEESLHRLWDKLEKNKLINKHFLKMLVFAKLKVFFEIDKQTLFKGAG